MLRKLTCYSIQMNVYECNGKNIFMSERWNVPFNEATAELNGTFHLSPNENILTIALINIHSFIHSFIISTFIHSFIYIYIYIYIYIVQSADMHVSAFYASSVQLGTRLDTCDTRIYIP